MPAVLIGKIIFRSDREAPSEDGNARTYVFDPETGQLGRLTALWPYEMALARDSWSADVRFRVFTKDAVRYKNVSTGLGQTEGVREDIPAIYWYDSFYKVENQLTKFGIGFAYEGVWSPTKEQIAFVSNDSGDDEIWIANRDGSQLLQLTQSNTEYNAREIGKDTFIPEINKHPSFSPDGKQIIFYSTRSGTYQLWIMNVDGSDQRLLMDWSPYNDWDPVWVKYADPPPPLPR
jgi:Tol biopolymer transport system component